MKKVSPKKLALLRESLRKLDEGVESGATGPICTSYKTCTC